MSIYLLTRLLLVLLICLFTSSQLYAVEIDSDPTVLPKFDQSDETISVVVGKRAVLPCFISLPETNLNQQQQRFASFKVIWMKVNSSTVLTMEDRAINGDPRISLLRAYAEDWSLQIDDIDEDDAGTYRCFINTGTFKTVILEVKVPPKIIDELTTESYPTPIRIGSDLVIKCHAQGKPTPMVRILAYDQYDNARIISEENEVVISNVTRHTHRRYECIASNGYPPDVARSFQFIFHYPPEMNLFVNNQLATTNVFSENYPNNIHLKCQVQMNPFDKIIWLKDGRPLTHHYQIYQIDHSVISDLNIRLFIDQDQGEYTCLASNALGTSSKSIQLLALSTPSSTTMKFSQTFTTASTGRRITPRRKRPKYSRITPMDSVSSQATESLRMMTLSSQGFREKLSPTLLFSVIIIIITVVHCVHR